MPDRLLVTHAHNHAGPAGGDRFLVLVLVQEVVLVLEVQVLEGAQVLDHRLVQHLV